MTDTIARKIEDTIKGSLSTARGRESKAIAHKLAHDILTLPYDGLCVVEENRPMTLGEALDIMPGAIRLATRIIPLAEACRSEKKNKLRTRKHTRRTHLTAKREAR